MLMVCMHALVINLIVIDSFARCLLSLSDNKPMYAVTWWMRNAFFPVNRTPKCICMFLETWSSKIVNTTNFLSNSDNNVEEVKPLHCLQNFASQLLTASAIPSTQQNSLYQTSTSLTSASNLLGSPLRVFCQPLIINWWVTAVIRLLDNERRGNDGRWRKLWRGLWQLSLTVDIWFQREDHALSLSLGH